MKITEEYVGHSGVKYIFEYNEVDSFEDLDYNKCKQVYGVCFNGDQVVIGFGGNKEDWGLIGGTIDEGETFTETLSREIQEESNMEVLSYIPLGYQKVTDTRDSSYFYQLRYVCKVSPFGPFVEDPDGGITEIKCIDPLNYKEYFDWGEIGERIMKKALELKNSLL